MATIAEIFTVAWNHQQAGAFAQAEKLYRQIVQADPTHADAWCFLGVACQAQGKLREAEAHFRRAVQLLPAHPSAGNYLGAVLVQQGKPAEAIASFQEALRFEPDNAELQSNLAVAFAELGNALANQEKLAEAIAHYQQALGIRPDFAEAHNNLGHALQRHGRLVEAMAHWREALRVKPDSAEVHNNLGNALQSEGKLEEAIAHYQQALRLQPAFAAAHNNLGNVLRNQGKLEEATRHWHEALHWRPDYAEPHYNLGKELQKLGRLEEALVHYEQALRLKADYADARWNRALIWLLQGDFEQGWPEYEWRWTQADFAARRFTQPRWDGSALGGRTILLHAEQGLGDTLHFIRYAPLVAKRGGSVVVECQPPLARLLGSAAGIDRLVPQGSPLPAFDVQAPLLSLPGIFRTALATVPATVPYLHADAELVEHWRRELWKSRKSEVGSRKSEHLHLTSDIRHPTSDFLVGIAWQGSPTFRGDRQRSIPLAQFAPLAEVPGVQLISLQKGPGTEQLREPFHSPLTTHHRLLSTVHRPPSTIHDLGSRLDEAAGGFMDSAAIMMSLDLVISSDTAIAHLAGAVGVPVWVALSLVPDWRWLLQREDSPWYPTMRLFRQARYGRWEDVFERMAEELKVVVSCQLSVVRKPITDN